MPPSRELTPFSFLVLGLVGERGESAHDLVRLMRQGRIYWATSPSQLYAEPKRLAALGYLDARTQPGQTRERTVYTLTDMGRRAIRDWMNGPASFPRIQHEASVRVLCADLTDPAAVLTSLQRMRSEVETILRDIEGMKQQAETLPHRRSFLLLNHWLAERICRLHLEWLEEAEQVLGGAPPGPA